ncbi:MAG: mechanosensitive ion channel family protein, partial [Azoarcus sp.]|nr:mechanosensitive ion channel family protein [Azoarcus sp.]
NAKEVLVIRRVRRGGEVDRTTVDAVTQLLRIAVFITSALVTLQSLGFSIEGVLAFGGIGGIAIGFAAKDLLANFFGSLIIYFDRPFAVGDWIRSPDRQIEGTVEAIGWRLTRIRTSDKRPLYVPNSVFTTISVENPSRMTHRRISETIGVRYDDIGAVAGIVEDIRAMLRAHPGIDQNQTMIVNFFQFSESSLDLMIHAFTRTTVWIEFHEIKQDVLLKIAEIIDRHGAQIAFPTRVNYIAPLSPEAGQTPAPWAVHELVRGA